LRLWTALPVVLTWETPMIFEPDSRQGKRGYANRFKSKVPAFTVRNGAFWPQADFRIW
jgi:hypothetical protein